MAATLWECVTNPAFVHDSPVAVSAEALGFPESQHDELARSVSSAFAQHMALDELHERGVGVGGAFPEFAALVDKQIADRRNAAAPTDDLLTKIMETEIDGRRLSDLHRVPSS